MRVMLQTSQDPVNQGIRVSGELVVSQLPVSFGIIRHSKVATTTHHKHPCTNY